MAVRARILTAFQTGVNPTGTEIPIIDGDATFDANAKVLATLDLATEGHESADPNLSPYGNELYVERGVRLGDETVEWVGLGYFRIDTVSEQSTSLGTLRVTGKDRMSQVIDSRRTHPKSFPSGTTVIAIFDFLIKEVFPSAVIEYDFGSELFISSTHICERDRYDFLNELATARGKIFYFDYRGVLVVKSSPEPTVSVFSLHGSKDGILLEPVHEERTREGIYNGIVAFGEKPSHNRLAYDGDSNSNTYWYGPFGKVPRFYYSPFITSQAQADSAAFSLISKILGEPFRLDLSMVPNPALEVLDMIEIIIPHHSTRQLLIQTLRVPLSAQQVMTCTTKDKASVIIGEE
jgi:hypothetical protein